MKVAEIDGDEPARLGGTRKMVPHITGSRLSYQIIKEFILTYYFDHYLMWQ